jgi:L-fuconate dehydratase
METTFLGGPMSAVFQRFELHDVRFPTSRSLDGSDAINRNPDYSAAYVTVQASSGERGHGFVFTTGRGNEVALAAVRAVEQLVVGLDVDEVLSDMGGFGRLLTHDSQLRWLGPEKGVVHMAMGAVLNAVWDLYARRQKLPLWKLLSDMSSDKLVGLVDFRHISDTLSPEEALEILERSRPTKPERERRLLAEGYPAYSTSVGWLGYPDEKLLELTKQAVSLGFDHLKLKVGAGPESDARRVKLVRELVGSGVRISVDANQAWEVPEAIENVGRLARFGLYWVEEPTSPDDIAGHLEIAKAVAPVLVATGEHVANRVVFKQLLSSGAIGVCQIDACRVAGVNENVAVLLLAAKFGTPVCPHAGGVGLCEVVQHLSMFDYVAVSGSNEGRWTEYVDHLHEHFATPARVKHGRYIAPTEPGSGAEMLPSSLALYSFPDGPVWQGAQ